MAGDPILGSSVILGAREVALAIHVGVAGINWLGNAARGSWTLEAPRTGVLSSYPIALLPFTSALLACVGTR